MAMVETRVNNDTWSVEFKSINEFYEYLCKTPFNESFMWEKHNSVEGSYFFTNTSSYEEAVNLMKNGWDDMAKKLTEKMRVIECQTAHICKARNVRSVAGYQAVVPRYLQGNPKSMIAKQMQPVKQKVVNITKSINYNCKTKTSTMIEESIKALQIVKKLESQGYRVNLNVSLGTEAKGRKIYAKVRIKSANERLNISKVAFAMCHPSMLRRLYLRFVEVYPNVTKSFVYGYGIPVSAYDMKKTYSEDIVLPAFIEFDQEKIQTLDDLKSSTGC